MFPEIRKLLDDLERTDPDSEQLRDGVEQFFGKIYRDGAHDTNAIIVGDDVCRVLAMYRAAPPLERLRKVTDWISLCREAAARYEAAP
jgi:hypothetical protein